MGLFDILGGSRRSSGMSPLTMALLGVLAYRTMKGKGRLADMLGAGKSTGGGLGGFGGGALSGGLQDLLDRFRQSGQGDKAQSWVSAGANKQIAPHELEEALGEERIQWLMQETGMSREELVAGLSRELPDAVDRLTPDGRVPDDNEADDIINDRPRRGSVPSAGGTRADLR
jgi:uncharacterized protein YidB (DUF937 family)